MAVQLLRPIADGYYTSWTSGYAQWDAGDPPGASGGDWIYNGTGYIYESCYLTARVTPRISVSALYLGGYAFKNSVAWVLTYGTMAGASWSELASDVNVDTFSPTLYLNFNPAVPSDAVLDNSNYGIGVYSIYTDCYVSSAWMTMTYTPVSGGFMMLCQSVLGAIGANLLLREMPALARELWRTSRGEHWLEPADYEPAWNALRELNVARAYVGV